MSPYEIESLTIAHWNLSACVAADVIAALALTAACITGLLIYGQVKIARLNVLLSLEQEMTQRCARFQESASLVGVDRPQVDEARHQYFSALDRLAWTILEGYFPGANLRQNYHERLAVVIRTYASDFASATRYRHIVRLHDHWQDHAS
jgi:hypothetical protein